MLGASPTVVLVAAVIGGAGLGWLVASRRHPGYVFAFSFLILGIAGLVIASFPAYLFDTGWWGQSPDDVLAPQTRASRVSWVVGASSASFALAAGVRALWAAPSSVPPTATGHASIRAGSSAAEAE